MKTFFYIIHRDGQIFEIENTGNRFVSALEQWQKGGLVVFPVLGIGLNTSDITKILNAEQYNAFIDSSHPKMFIKNGAWYENKNRDRPVRYEKWRHEELEAKRNMFIGIGEYQGPKATQEEINGWLKKYRPEFMKERDRLISKIKVVNEVKVIDEYSPFSA